MFHEDVTANQMLQYFNIKLLKHFGVWTSEVPFIPGSRVGTLWYFCTNPSWPITFIHHTLISRFSSSRNHDPLSQLPYTTPTKIPVFMLRYNFMFNQLFQYFNSIYWTYVFLQASMTFTFGGAAFHFRDRLTWATQLTDRMSPSRRYTQTSDWCRCHWNDLIQYPPSRHSQAPWTATPIEWASMAQSLPSTAHRHDPPQWWCPHLLWKLPNTTHPRRVSPLHPRLGGRSRWSSVVGDSKKRAWISQLLSTLTVQRQEMVSIGIMPKS